MRKSITTTILIFLVVFSLLLIALTLNLGAPVASSTLYTEERPKDFVLSQEMPISIGHGILGNQTTSTEPVDILVHDVHFRIPRNYIDSIYPDARTMTVGFELQTLYPDFKGLPDLETKAKYYGTENWTRSVNQIEIYDNYTPSPRAEHDPNILWLKDIKTEPVEKWQYELYKFTEFKSAEKYYYKVPDKNEMIYILCVIDDYDDNDSYCSSYYKISEEVMIIYKYHKKLLPHWKEIHEKIAQLMKTFVVKTGIKHKEINQ